MFPCLRFAFSAGNRRYFTSGDLNEPNHHVPVLPSEVKKVILPGLRSSNDLPIFVDGTFGAGGHSLLILGLH